MARPRLRVVLTPDISPVSQIVEQIERAVALGWQLPGDALPGAGELAKELGITRVTVQKAYGLLIARNVAESRAGEGTYVAHDADARPALLRRTFSNAISLGQSLYMSKSEIVKAFESEVTRHFQRGGAAKPARRKPPEE